MSTRFESYANLSESWSASSSSEDSLPSLIKLEKKAPLRITVLEEEIPNSEASSADLTENTCLSLIGFE